MPTPPPTQQNPAHTVLLLKLWRYYIFTNDGNVLSQVIPVGKFDASFQCSLECEANGKVTRVGKR